VGQTTQRSAAIVQFEAPYGPSTPSLYAQFAQRYMTHYIMEPVDKG